MPISITNENKNSANTVSNETKLASTDTWANRNLTWADAGAAGDTWAIGGNAIVKESKNLASTVSNEVKT